MPRPVALLVLLAALGPAVPARAADAPARVTAIEGITEYRLPNGLRVLLMPDPSRPLVHVRCAVLVGSRHEGYGEAGMAHLLEHMLIKGTKAHPDIMKTLRDRGATNANAYTTYDKTEFVESLPASDDNLAFAIGLEADRLVNSVVKRDELLTEMTVVRNEFEGRENDAPTVLAERMAHAAFRWHNYGKTLIGNRSDIERVPVDNLNAFYKKHYRVDNAVLVVTGRFDEAKALALVAQHFGPIPRPQAPLAPAYTREPGQDGERHVTLRRVGTVGAVGAVYHIPAGSHPDYPAVMVLASCLTDTPGGRLHKALVDTKTVVSVGGDASGYHDPWLMRFTARVENPAGVDAARDALLTTLESLADKPITAAEVDLARQRYARLYEQAQDDAGLMAEQLSFYAGVGDWRLFFWERDRTAKVTAADVNRVAGTYLRRNNRTVGVYHPGKTTERVDVPEATDVAKMLDGFAGRERAARAAAFDPTPANIEARVTRGTLGAIKTAFLPKPTGGEEVRLVLNLRYGTEESLNGRSVAAELLPFMLTYGTKTRTRQQFSDDLNRLGAGLNVSGSGGLLVVQMNAKKGHLPATLAIVREMLREPAFPPAEFDALKARVLAGLAAGKSEPGSLAGEAVRRVLKAYAKTDVRYEPTTDELIERVKALTVADVKALYADQLGASAGELAVVGDFDPAVVTAGLEPALAGWSKAVGYKRYASPAVPVARGETIRIETPDKASAVYLARLSFPMTDRDGDYAAARVGAYILGGHTIVSRLGDRVRKEKGLSYGIEAAFTAHALDPAAEFVIMAGTNPANMGKVRDLVAGELKRFLADGVTAAELDAAKKAIVQEAMVSLTDDLSLAAVLANGRWLDRTMAHQTELLRQVGALTPADVRRAFGRVVDPAKLVIAEAGDFAAAGKDAVK